mgnify:CR=1 FL=1
MSPALDKNPSELNLSIYKDVVNYQAEHEWIPIKEKVKFPEGKNWKDYVDSRRLEITCGEAPYLVSRYDTSTGEFIKINKRIGGTVPFNPSICQIFQLIIFAILRSSDFSGCLCNLLSK